MLYLFIIMLYYVSKYVKVKWTFNARAFLQHLYLELKLLRGITKTNAWTINRFFGLCVDFS